MHIRVCEQEPLPRIMDRRASFWKSARSPTLLLPRQMYVTLSTYAGALWWLRSRSIWNGYDGPLGLLGTRSRVPVK